MTGLRILVTGSRDWADWHTVEVALRYHALRLGALGREVTVVHGDARGADTCADILASRMRFKIERHRADWKRHGKAAGPLRNAEMVALGADVCLAFPIGPSPGTRDCIAKAEAAGIPVIVYEGSEA